MSLATLDAQSRGTPDKPTHIVQGYRNNPITGVSDPWTTQPRISDSASITGSYSVAPSMVIGAGLAGGTTALSMRNAGPYLVGITKVTLSGVVTTGFTAAQEMAINLFVARGWTTSDTGGSAITPFVGNSQKKRTSYANSTIADLRTIFTAITPGNRTLDGTAIARAAGFAPAAAALLFQNFVIQDNTQTGPLICAANEGIVLTLGDATPAAGALILTAQIEWFEATAW